MNQTQVIISFTKNVILIPATVIIGHPLIDTGMKQCNGIIDLLPDILFGIECFDECLIWKESPDQTQLDKLWFLNGNLDS